MPEYSPQVDRSHYRKGSYRSKERWISYWHQLTLVRRFSPATVLEIGPGEGIVTDALRKEGIVVTTCDIAPDVHPDVVGSITALPFPDREFDVVLAAEVLEHIQFDDVLLALRELARTARRSVVVSVPHPGWVFLLTLKIPLLRRFESLLQIPFFWQRHAFNGEHYWELGKRGYSVGRFLDSAREAGLSLISSTKYADDPVHRFFVFEKLL